MRAGHELVMMFPEDERRRFLGALAEHGGAAEDALARVDVKTAESFDPADKERIMGQVEEVGGAAKVNEVVIAALNRALADVAARAAEEDVASQVALCAALYLRDLGRLGEARALCERVATARRVAEAAGEGTVGGALDARGCVGNIMAMQGELEGARATLEEAVAGWATVPGSERDARALGAKERLAVVMAEQNELEGAQALYEAVVEGYEAVYGGEDPETLVAKGNLANVMMDQGDLAGARGLYEAVAEAQTQQLGPRHASTLDTKGNLGVVMKKQGDLPGARAVYEAVAEAQTQQLGPRHASTLDTKGNLGSLLATMAIAAKRNGERAEAAGLYCAAADMCELRYGKENDVVVYCRAKARELGA